MEQFSFLRVTLVRLTNKQEKSSLIFWSSFLTVASSSPPLFLTVISCAIFIPSRSAVDVHLCSKIPPPYWTSVCSLSTTAVSAVVLFFHVVHLVFDARHVCQDPAIVFLLSLVFFFALSFVPDILLLLLLGSDALSLLFDDDRVLDTSREKKEIERGASSKTLCTVCYSVCTVCLLLLLPSIRFASYLLSMILRCSHLLLALYSLPLSMNRMVHTSRSPSDGFHHTTPWLFSSLPPSLLIFLFSSYAASDIPSLQPFCITRWCSTSWRGSPFLLSDLSLDSMSGNLFIIKHIRTHSLSPPFSSSRWSHHAYDEIFCSLRTRSCFFALKSKILQNLQHFFSTCVSISCVCVYMWLLRVSSHFPFSCLCACE